MQVRSEGGGEGGMVSVADACIYPFSELSRVSKRFDLPILLGHKGSMRMFWQWVRVLWRERGLDAFKAVWRGYWMMQYHSVSKVEWIRRMKICMKCPIYDKEYKACRLGKMGCGCYVPYSNLVKDQCWIREHYGKKFGWGKEDVDNG